MAKVIFIVLCCVCLLLLESANSLKCKTNVQQADDQFRKVVQICKKRHNASNNGDSSSNEDDDESDILNKIFMKGGDSSNTQSWKHGNEQRGSGVRHSFNQTNGNWRSTQRPNHGNSNNRDFGYPDGSARGGLGFDQTNSNFGNSNKDYERACIIQCFFNEMNAVDQRGFPEQELIINLITHSIQNPELQDFVEEAIIECFHFLSTDMRQDKCYFSQNLLSCLADKGKERCEDWSH